MEFEFGLALWMDVVVLLALAATIFYAMRLSNSLNAFKKHREEFQKLMGDVTISIDQAYRAIEELKDASSQANEELGETLNDSRFVLDELRLVNEASDNLAHRLEQLAQKGRQAMASDVPAASVAPASPSPSPQKRAPAARAPQPAKGGAETPIGKTLSGIDALINKKPEKRNEIKPKPADADTWQSSLAVKIKAEEDKAPAAGGFAIRDPDYEREPEVSDAGADAQASAFGSQAERDLYEALHGKSR